MKNNPVDSANALIIYKDKILLFHRDNIPTIPAPDAWSFPGGGIEKGETPEEAIVRELKEEIGHSPATLKFLFRQKKKDGKYNYLYGAFVDESEASLFKLGPGEGQEIAFFSLAEIDNLKLPKELKNKLDKYSQLLKIIIVEKSFNKIAYLQSK